MDDGKTHNVHIRQYMKSQYRDEYTNELLPSEWVHAAMHDELSFLNEKVWHGVSLKAALADPGSTQIGTRWVVNNKGDANEPDVRARVVAQEEAQYGDSSFFCSDPSTGEQAHAPVAVGDGAQPRRTTPEVISY